MASKKMSLKSLPVRSVIILATLTAGIIVIVAQWQSIHRLFLSKADIFKQATEMTVMIDGYNSGSGVIYKHEGSEYSVVTAKHTVSKSDVNYLLVTYDKERYEVKSIQLIPNLDVAIIKFYSSKQYLVGSLGDSNQFMGGQPINIAGAPRPTTLLPNRSVIVTSGRIIGRNDGANDGYSLIYDNSTQPGMSGGPVLDDYGRIIGVHGQGDRNAEGKSGVNYGIPINLALPDMVRPAMLRFFWAYWQWIIVSGLVLIISVKAIKSGRIHVFILGEKKLTSDSTASTPTRTIKTSLEDTIASSSSKAHKSSPLTPTPPKSSRLTPTPPKSSPLTPTPPKSSLLTYTPPKSSRLTYTPPKSSPLTPTPSKSSRLTYTPPSTIDDASFYNDRGVRSHNSCKYQEAIKDFSEAIKINANESAFKFNTDLEASYYFNRGLSYEMSKELQKAFDDYAQAIRINSEYAKAYEYQGDVCEKMGSKKAAISDYIFAAQFYLKQGEEQKALEVLKKQKKLEYG